MKKSNYYQIDIWSRNLKLNIQTYPTLNRWSFFDITGCLEFFCFLMMFGLANNSKTREYYLNLKLSPGLNFINVLRAAFAHTYPKCVKTTDKLSIFLCFRDLWALKMHIKCWWNWHQATWQPSTSIDWIYFFQLATLHTFSLTLLFQFSEPLYFWDHITLLQNNLRLNHSWLWQWFKAMEEKETEKCYHLM